LHFYLEHINSCADTFCTLFFKFISPKMIMIFFKSRDFFLFGKFSSGLTVVNIYITLIIILMIYFRYLEQMPPDFGQHTMGPGPGVFNSPPGSGHAMFGGMPGSRPEAFGGMPGSNPVMFGGMPGSSPAVFGGMPGSSPAMFGCPPKSGAPVIGGSHGANQSTSRYDDRK
jgi:hypothetical protein